MSYAELCVTTNFTFLTGASHPEEMVTRAAELGLEAIAITDRNSLAGVVRAYAALKALRREADEAAIRIRSQHRIDPCSRQEVGQAAPIARPEAPRLPRLITGCRLVLRDSPVEKNVTSGSWQQQLRSWADAELHAGRQDILASAVPVFERTLIETALNHTRGRKRDAAELLGWGRNTLTRKLKELGMNDEEDH